MDQDTQEGGVDDQGLHEALHQGAEDKGEETLFLREVFEIRIDAKNDTLTV